MHKWLMRHVYAPVSSVTGVKLVGMIMAFVVSALFHELAVSVPLRTYRGYAFFGMLA